MTGLRGRQTFNHIKLNRVPTSLGSAARALGYDQDKLPDGATGWDLCHNHKIRQ